MKMGEKWVYLSPGLIFRKADMIFHSSFHPHDQLKESSSSSLDHMNACVMTNCICQPGRAEGGPASQSNMSSLCVCLGMRAFPESLRLLTAVEHHQSICSKSRDNGERREGWIHSLWWSWTIIYLLLSLDIWTPGSGFQVELQRPHWFSWVITLRTIGFLSLHNHIN